MEIEAKLYKDELELDVDGNTERLRRMSLAASMFVREDDSTIVTEKVQFEQHDDFDLHIINTVQCVYRL
jgi:hypothetical protein